MNENLKAMEILNQLGGNKFISMAGARNFISDANSLTFKIMRNFTGITHVVIKVNALDLYDIEFLKINIRQKIVKGLRFDIFAKDLQDVFSEATGLQREYSCL